MRKLIVVVVALAGLTACVPIGQPGWKRDLREWVSLHEEKPRLAVRHLKRHHGYVPAPKPAPEPEGSGVYWPWTALAECESNGNWHINTGNGYYGGLQFALGSWRAAGGSGYPHHASPAEQVRRGEILQDMQGWGAWPTCSRVVGLR